MSHDRFLSKLQRYSSDAISPLAFLLDAVQQSKELSQDEVTEALQAAISLIGNAHCSLNTERRRCILSQLNSQLVPMADEVLPSEGSLFGNDFGKVAKERMDSIKSLTQSSSVFFWLGDPHATNPHRAREVAEKAQQTHTVTLLTGRKRVPSGAHPHLH